MTVPDGFKTESVPQMMDVGSNVQTLIKLNPRLLVCFAYSAKMLPLHIE